MKKNNIILLIIITGVCVCLFICKNPSDSNQGPVPNIPSISEPIVSATKIRMFYGSSYNGHPIDSFTIYWSLIQGQGTAGNPIYGLYDNSEPYTHCGLTPNTNYYYTVVAYNKYGASQPSNDTCITTDSLYIPDYLHAAPSSETTIGVNWNTSYNIYYLDTVSYKVYWSTQSGQGTNAQYSQASTEMTTVLTGMPTFTKYYFTVTTIIGSYESAPSQESCFRTAGKIADLTIPDDSLKTALSNIYQTDVHECDSLYLSDKGIKNISGLEWFSNLWTLYLDSNEISDLTPLEDLHSLHKLHAKKNQISDIEVLLSLKGLSYVDLASNSIDIPCSHLQELIDSLGLGNIIPYQAIDGVTCTN